MSLVAWNRAQPVPGPPPESTGRAPEAAVQTTLCPPVPESRASRTSGEVIRYVPSASCTRTSPVMFWSTPRTRAWARPRVRTGFAEDVPSLASLPVGETKIVAWVAARAAGTTAAAATPSTDRATVARTDPRARVIPLTSTGRLGQVAGRDRNRLATPS